MKKNNIQNLYEYMTEEDRLSFMLIEIKSIISGFGFEDDLTNLEKIHSIHDVVFQYNRNHIKNLKNSLKEKYKIDLKTLEIK